MDKNLGLAVMNRDLYIEQVLREHLTTPTYLQLTSENALFEINNTKQLLLNAFHTQKNLLSQPKITYFTRSFKENHRVPIFYGMPKVHKNPMNLRPVESCINSFPSIFSTWLDFKMKELFTFIPSYIKIPPSSLKNSNNSNYLQEPRSLPQMSPLCTPT
jgi:hypothetical protein